MKQPYIRQGQIDSAFFLCWLFVAAIVAAVVWVAAIWIGWVTA